jgi:RNA polymerase sigma factor (TIGR02999 family)
MRRILVEKARARGRDKRGGGRARVPLEEAAPHAAAADVDLVALDEALEKLAAYDRLKAEIVQLRYFAGLTIDEVAEALQSAPATIKTEWAFARDWLHRALAEP